MKRPLFPSRDRLLPSKTRLILDEERGRSYRFLMGLSSLAVVSGVVTAVEYLFADEALAAALSVFIGLWAAVNVVMQWLLWRVPEMTFRMAIPTQAYRGGCTQCEALYVRTDEGTLIWHAVLCVHGARVELRRTNYS
jgi:hypothetical protein